MKGHENFDNFLLLFRIRNDILTNIRFPPKHKNFLNLCSKFPEMFLLKGENLSILQNINFESQ